MQPLTFDSKDCEQPSEKASLAFQGIAMIDLYYEAIFVTCTCLSTYFFTINFYFFTKCYLLFCVKINFL